MLRNEEATPTLSAENRASALLFSVLILMTAARMIVSRGLTSSLDPYLVIALTYLIAFGLPLLLFGLRYRREADFGELFHRRRPATARYIVSSLFLLIVSVILGKTASALLFDAAIPSIQVAASEDTPFWVVIIVSVLLPALLEELLLRGIVFSLYEDSCGGLCAILAGALGFALIHFSPADIGTYFFAGCILGTVVYITRSIYPAILLHFLNNLLSLYFESSVFRIAIESKSGILALFVLTALAMLLLFITIGDLEVICRKRSLACANADEEEDGTDCIRLTNADKPFPKAVLSVLVSPFLWAAIVVFILTVTLL